MKTLCIIIFSVKSKLLVVFSCWFCHFFRVITTYFLPQYKWKSYDVGNTTKRDHAQKFPWNQFCSYFFLVKHWFDGKKFWIFRKAVIVFLTTFPNYLCLFMFFINDCDTCIFPWNQIVFVKEMCHLFQRTIVIKRNLSNFTKYCSMFCNLQIVLYYSVNSRNFIHFLQNCLKTVLKYLVKNFMLCHWFHEVF